MFTGIIEAVGRVRETDQAANGRRLAIDAPGIIHGMRPGDSIAVDGVCLTAVALREDGFAVDVVGTTLGRTTLGGLATGDTVNLERALALGDRLGGHIVQGHVDAVGAVTEIRRDGGHVLLTVRLPEIVAQVTVPRGSIAIQGVSLTVSELPGPDLAQVALIPYTWEHTTLNRLEPGDPVNLEGDMFGRFVAQYMKRIGR